MSRERCHRLSSLRQITFCSLISFLYKGARGLIVMTLLRKGACLSKIEERTESYILQKIVVWWACFKKPTLWSALLERWVFGGRFHGISVDGRANQRKKLSLFNQSRIRADGALFDKKQKWLWLRKSTTQNETDILLWKGSRLQSFQWKRLIQYLNNKGYIKPFFEPDNKPKTHETHSLIYPRIHETTLSFPDVL